MTSMKLAEINFFLFSKRGVFDVQNVHFLARSNFRKCINLVAAGWKELRERLSCDRCAGKMKVVSA